MFLNQLFGCGSQLGGPRTFTNQSENPGLAQLSGAGIVSQCLGAV